MKLQSYRTGVLPLRLRPTPLQAQPPVPDPPPEVPDPPPEVGWGERLTRFGLKAARGAAGAAVGAIPSGLAGYAMASWGGVPGGILGGVTGAALGYLSGRRAYEAARSLMNDNPEQLGWTQKLALRLGKAAPFAWAAFSAANGAVAAATFPPAVAAAVFAKKGVVAGALLSSAFAS